jgi:hypothetical protein
LLCHKNLLSKKQSSFISKMKIISEFANFDDDGFPPGTEFDVDPTMNPFMHNKVNGVDPFFGSATKFFEHGFGLQASHADDPQDILLSHDAFKATLADDESRAFPANHPQTAYGRSPSRNVAVDRLAAEKMSLLEKAKQLSSKKRNVYIVSKLPTHVAEDLEKNRERIRSISSRSTAAQCSPVTIVRKSSAGFNGTLAENTFGLEVQIATNSPRNFIQCEDLSGSVNKKQGVGRSVDIIKSASPKEAKRRSLSRTKSRCIGIGPKMNPQRSQDSPQSGSNCCGLPLLPLPPFSSPDDKAQDCNGAKHAIKPKRVVSPRTNAKVRSLSPAVSSARSHSKNSLQDGQFQAKPHHLLVKSHSKRVRSQSPCVPRGTVESRVLARSPSRSQQRQLDSKLHSNKSFQSSSLAAPRGGKKKSHSFGDEKVFSVIWQRFPDGVSKTLKESIAKDPRPVSLSPVAAQRRKVGGTGMRLRSVERNSTRSHKDVGDERSFRRGKKKDQDPAGRIFRSDGPSDDLGRCFSGGLGGRKGKEMTGFNDRFTAVAKETDFPPLSPLRKLSTKASIATVAFLVSTPFQADVAFPQQSQRSSCV